MRHITDGELHAYLDGSLDQLPEGRGGEVRDHLDACATCKERLQDEEEIRNQAQEILANTTPPEVELPSFEELRARAEAGGPTPVEGEDVTPTRRRGPLRGLPLAWAATVVLALGVGWMGGEVMRLEAPPDFGDAQPPSPALQPAVSGGRIDEDPAEGQPAGQGEDVAANSSGALLDSREAPAGVAGIARARDREEAPPTAEAESVRTEAARRISESVEAREKSVVQESPFPEARADLGAAITGASFRAAPLDDPSESQADSAEPAADLVGEEGAMAVPGLEVVTVEWEEWIPGERALHIRQLLPMGDTLELRYVGLLMGSDPEASDALLLQGRGVAGEEAPERPLSPKVMEASLPAGWNQVVMRWRRGWLVARAPLSEESLRGILRSIR